MDRRKTILIGLGLLVALGAALIARNMFFGEPAPQVTAAPVMPAVEEDDGPKVLVATRELMVGTIITPDALKFQSWPDDLVQNAYFIEGQADINSLLGTVVRNDITAGAPLTQGALVKPGERGFLAAALSPGMRAVTVPVSDSTAVAGFIFPGDRVDLVLTSSISGDDDARNFQASETIVRNLRVLATDQRTKTTEDEEGQTEVKTYSTVTVEATPRLAEKIAVSQELGKLSLSLRSIADNYSELEKSIASGAVKVPEDDDPESEKKFLDKMANLPSDAKSSYVTGGDVSRFGRSTIPTQKPKAEAAAAAAAEKKVPTVRVARGNNVQEVPVGGAK